MTTGDDQFYSNLESTKTTLSALLLHQDAFRNIPKDWHVIITDITNSTEAVLNGRHHDINFIATGSIVVVLNIAFELNIHVPFFFGGDGATFIVPSCVVHKSIEALDVYSANILGNFNLNLRIGTVPVEDIYKEGHQITVAKFSGSTRLTLPVILGNGLAYAERVVKSAGFRQPSAGESNQQPNLKGMLCRWDTIEAPKKGEEIVTLLVNAKQSPEQAAVYSAILQKIDEVYGDAEARRAISVAKLRFHTTFKRLGTEMRIREGGIKLVALIKAWITCGYIRFYFNTKNGKRYLNSLVEMSDTLILDGKINTVISGTAGQRLKLVKLLDEMEAENKIIYGIHISTASVMSCYVRNIEDDHIHFVDGADGGYTKAAQMFKKKLS
ncbi:DUF3095 family protein [Flavobacterium humi]|uniref:DUF3095 domain-containing protein n=1 Tax=Flavobacterium humi TaxID=2562683 RepID=A0A4Z0L416_9FLAO|nr:DUF3095 family protein [Flavobacterium humi]TGD56679.1 DUF3095 domain-containing protein [Flavobacterium humi]